ncbi:MAG: hypothetical protein ABJM06_14580 [Gilvibacter sp.]
MKLFRRVFNFYITSSIHVALAIVALCLIAIKSLGLAIDFTLIAYIFLASVSGYNFIKYAEVAKWYHRSLPQEVRGIQIFSFLVFVALVYVAFKLPLPTLYASGALAVITFFYAVPLLPTKNTLRGIKGLKIYVIALVWALTAVLLPLANAGGQAHLDAILLTAQLFLWVVALTIPFELRDLQSDSPLLYTIPQLIGSKNAVRVGVLLYLLIWVLEGFKHEVSNGLLLCWMVVTVLGIWALFKARRDQSLYFASFWVEGIPILGAVVLFGWNQLFG